MTEGGAVLAGASGSLLLHPREFIDSRNEAEAILVLGLRARARDSVAPCRATEACFV